MRERLFLFFLILGFGILVVRLFTLQILRGEYYRQLTEGNRIKTTKVPALRGVIYDRKSRVLVRNTLEGREYIYGPVLAHVLGYLGEINEEELEFYKKKNNNQQIVWGKSLTDIRKQNEENLKSREIQITKNNFLSSYALGDIIGKMGIEKTYDLILRGIDGGLLEEVDAEGRVVRKLGERKPVEGENLHLTIDLALQQKIFEVLNKEKKAAAVATNPKTGEVLALVSVPSFDPNLFTLKPSSSDLERVSKQINEVLNHPDQPMFNRVIGGQYPPGSTFKIVTAIAGLMEGKINRQTKIEDTGRITVGPWTFGNWYFNQYGKTEGWLDVVRALARSNDIFFYKVGEWLGGEKLAEWARRFGLGERSGIDLEGEAQGLVPDKKWKKEVKGEDWFLGDDFITAIGQGDLLTTPLQINLMTAVVANGGKLCRPTLLSVKEKCKNLEIKKEYLDLVKEGMKEACAPGGTGWPFFKFKIQNENIKVDEENFLGPEASDSAGVVYLPVVCKTGTAEAPGEKSKTHAWFTVFAPVKNPELVLTVLVENGGEGSSVAGPIAKEILKWYFENKKE